MTTIRVYANLEPETRADIEARRKDGDPCGCHRLAEGEWSICDWHDGYEDGVVRMKLRGGL